MNSSTCSSLFISTTTCAQWYEYPIESETNGGVRSTHYLRDRCRCRLCREGLDIRVTRHVIRDGLLRHDFVYLFEIVTEIAGPLLTHVLWRNRLIVYPESTSQLKAQQRMRKACARMIQYRAWLSSMATPYDCLGSPARTHASRSFLKEGWSVVTPSLRRPVMSSTTGSDIGAKRSTMLGGMRNSVPYMPFRQMMRSSTLCDGL